MLRFTPTTSKTVWTKSLYFQYAFLRHTSAASLSILCRRRD